MCIFAEINLSYIFELTITKNMSLANSFRQIKKLSGTFHDRHTEISR